MKRLALFDFDGTITYKDTLLEFIKYTCGKRAFWLGFLKISPIMVLYKAGLFPNWRAKEMAMKQFWSGMPISEFNRKGEEFARQVIPGLCRPAAIDRIRQYQMEGWEVVVVSASASNWLKNWAEDLNLTLIATQLEVKEEHITGKIEGKNCYGPEKERRIRELLNLDEYEDIHAYGDSGGDREMLQLTHQSFYKPFTA